MLALPTEKNRWTRQRKEQFQILVFRPQALDGSVILRTAELSWVVEGILNEEIMEG